MPGPEPTRPSFDVAHDAEPDSDALVAGLSEFGLAGLTAADYLVDQFELEATGHVSADGVPAITPFENGQPRRHTRLFSGPDVDVTILVSELPIPAWAADPFSEAVLDWLGANGVGELSVLSGVPVQHGPEDHRTFYIATDDYRERRLADAEVTGMGRGFLDGVNGRFVDRGIDSPLAVGVLTTPVHPRAPDVEAALRLLDTVRSLYDLEFDTGPLESFAAEVEQYYRDLTDRMEAVEDEPLPEDRMYM